ncbi:MAG: hypothetical protein AAF542_07315 [Pseudomonadota bacterium]
MDFKDFVTGLSKVFSNESLLTVSFIFISLYVLFFSLVYLFDLIKNVRALANFQSLIERYPDNGYVILRSLLGLGEPPEDINVPDSERNKGRIATFITFLSQQWPLFERLGSTLSATRIEPATRKLLESFENVRIDLHFLEGVRPSSEFLCSHLTESKISIERAFTTLTQFSLAVTFAGLASVLVISGDSIAEIANKDIDIGEIIQEGNSKYGSEPSNNVEKSTSSSADITEPVLDILKAAGSKFWITAFAYSLGLFMLVAYYTGERFLKFRLARFGDALEKVLGSDLAQDYTSSSDDILSSKEKNSFQKILTENAENIANLGKEVNDKLIEKLGLIATDLDTITERVLLNINTSFNDLQSQGIRVQVQDSFSTTVNKVLESITDDSAFVSRQISELTTDMSAFLDRLENAIESEEEASSGAKHSIALESSISQLNSNFEQLFSQTSLLLAGCKEELDIIKQHSAQTAAGIIAVNDKMEDAGKNVEN